MALSIRTAAVAAVLALPAFSALTLAPVARAEGVIVDDRARLRQETERSRAVLERAEWDLREARGAAARADQAYFAYSARAADLARLIDEQAARANDFRQGVRAAQADLRRVEDDIRGFETEANNRRRAVDDGRARFDAAKAALDAAVDDATRQFEAGNVFKNALQRVERAEAALKDAEDRVLRALEQTREFRDALAVAEQAEAKVKQLRDHGPDEEVPAASQRWIEAKNVLGNMQQKALDASPEVAAARQAVAGEKRGVEELRRNFFEKELPDLPVVAARQATVDAEGQALAADEAAFQNARRQADDARRARERIAADFDRQRQCLADAERAVNQLEAERQATEIAAQNADFDRVRFSDAIGIAYNNVEVAARTYRDAKEFEDRGRVVIVVGPDRPRDGPDHGRPGDREHHDRDRDGDGRPDHHPPQPTTKPIQIARPPGSGSAPLIRPGIKPTTNPAGPTVVTKFPDPDAARRAEQRTAEMQRQAEAQRGQQLAQDVQRRGAMVDAERAAARSLVDAQAEAERQRPAQEQRIRAAGAGTSPRAFLEARRREFAAEQSARRNLQDGQAQADASGAAKLDDQRKAAEQATRKAQEQADRRRNDEAQAAREAARATAERQRQAERAAAQQASQQAAQEQRQRMAERQAQQQAEREARQQAAQEAARQRAEQASAARAEAAEQRRQAAADDQRNRDAAASSSSAAASSPDPRVRRR